MLRCETPSALTSSALLHSPADLKGSIDLNTCWHISEELQTRKHDYAFCVAVPGRKYFLVAGSASQRDKWIACLR